MRYFAASLLVLLVASLCRTEKSSRTSSWKSLFRSSDSEVESSLQDLEASERLFTNNIPVNIFGGGLFAWLGYIPIYIFVRKHCTTCYVTSTAISVTTTTTRLTTFKISSAKSTKYSTTTLKLTSTPVIVTQSTTQLISTQTLTSTSAQITTTTSINTQTFISTALTITTASTMNAGRMFTFDDTDHPLLNIFNNRALQMTETATLNSKCVDDIELNDSFDWDADESGEEA